METFVKARKWMLVFTAFLVAAAVHADTRVASGQVLDGVTIKATPTQMARLRSAIASSPALQAQMKALAASGKLTDIVVGDIADSPPKAWPFSAWIHGTTWVFRSDFIEQHGKNRLFHVVKPDDILPDNLVFALGHLAYETQTASEQISPAAASASHISKQQWIAARMSNDASATIQGWNDTVDTAELENGSKPLSVSQAGDLLLNLRYRGPLIRAIKAQSDQAGKQSLMANDGNVAMTPVNVAAVAEALSSTPLFDVQ